MIICNSFSINMLPKFIGSCDIHIESISRDGAAYLAQHAWAEEKLQSVIGHPDIAAIVKADLGLDMDLYNRTTFKWDSKKDNLLVAQYIGERLPEGTKTLPKGAAIVYYLILRL